MNFNIEFMLIQAPVILFALTVHEFCHAWVANYLGDDTARKQGRLTLNPIAHLDVLGTILMFLVGFGWARPVPVNALNFKDPKKGMLLVASAGPLSNVLMAIIAGILLRLYLPNLLNEGHSVSGLESTFLIVLILTLLYGVALAVFNMLPIPPLDGSRVLYGILPDRHAKTYIRLEPYGMIVLFGLFIFGRQVLSYVLWLPVSIISSIFSGFSYTQLWSIISYLSG